MITDAKRLIPENLQWVIDRYAVDFQSGYEQHTSKFTDQDVLINSILVDSESAIQAFTTRMSYATGSRLLGQTARKVTNLHELLIQPERLNNSQWPTDYAIFLQKNRPFIRIRWTGSDVRPRDQKALLELLQSAAAKKMKVSTILEETLNRENKNIAEYDVLSAPFGVGSIAYSSSVKTIRNREKLWYQKPGYKVVGGFS